MWILLQLGHHGYRWIAAEPPCLKGELRCSLGLFTVTIIWQREERPV